MNKPASVPETFFFFTMSGQRKKNERYTAAGGTFAPNCSEVILVSI